MGETPVFLLSVYGSTNRIDMSESFDLIKQYLQFRKGREGLQKNEDHVKKSLMESLTYEVEADEKGNSFIYLPEPMDGVEAVKRERRVSQILDEDAALELIKKYGLEEDCLETITVLNEDGLLAANFAGVIADDEIAALYSEKETYAFILVKEK
jgi:hypothetical protein